jgi:hypothetical protein
LTSFFTFMILYSTLVPISLYISVEMIRYGTYMHGCEGNAYGRLAARCMVTISCSNHCIFADGYCICLIINCFPFTRPQVGPEHAH